MVEERRDVLRVNNSISDGTGVDRQVSDPSARIYVTAAAGALLFFLIAHGFLCRKNEIWPLVHYPMYAGLHKQVCRPIHRLVVNVIGQDNQRFEIDLSRLFNYYDNSDSEYLKALSVLAGALQGKKPYLDAWYHKLEIVYGLRDSMSAEVWLETWDVDPKQFVGQVGAGAEPTERLLRWTLPATQPFSRHVVPMATGCHNALYLPDFIQYVY